MHTRTAAPQHIQTSIACSATRFRAHMHAAECIHIRALAGAIRPGLTRRGAAYAFRRHTLTAPHRSLSLSLSLTHSSVRARGTSWRSSHDSPSEADHRESDGEGGVTLRRRGRRVGESSSTHSSVQERDVDRGSFFDPPRRPPAPDASSPLSPPCVATCRGIIAFVARAPAAPRRAQTPKPHSRARRA